MAFINGFGQLVDGQPQDYLLQQVADMDARPWQGMFKRLKARNLRFDVQDCPKGYWATAEGLLLKIRAISDRHLLNSIAFMERRVKGRVIKETLRMSAYDGGEHAMDAVQEAMVELHMLEDKMDAAKDRGTEYGNKLYEKYRRELCQLVWPKYKELEQERDRRGL